ncbi:MAG TPA: hypothetical protein VM782_04225 [Stellaceae bacterium]|nr:hypothetical protein [Stellaceae bacterium]
MASYNLQQQAFALAMMAGSEGKPGIQGNAQTLATYLANAIQNYFTNDQMIGLIGNWSITWGPWVWQDSPTSDVVDNAMFAAQNSATNTIVVAVAGTNPVSNWDWVDEDYAVSTLGLLPNGNNVAQVSTGTITGLNILLGFGSGAPPIGSWACGGSNSSQTIAQYLQAAASSSATLIIAGHSLGGALASALATSLFNSTGGLLNGSQWTLANIGVLPIAAPSVGDQAFCTLYASTFSGSQIFYERYYNTIDEIPQCWDPSTCSAKQLEDLYAPNLEPCTCIDSLVTSTLSNANPPPSTYLALPSTSFTGQFQSGTLENTTCTFMAQVSYQHVLAYFEQIAPELVSLMNPTNPYSAKAKRDIDYEYNQKIKGNYSGCT